MQFAVFGNITCDEESDVPCSSCMINATGLQPTFLLYKDSYSQSTAEEWEEKVFIANIKSFNKMFDYHADIKDD